MADWTALPDTAVGIGGLPSGTTVTALRDNAIAIAEGAAGAPRIQTAAIQNNAVTTAKIATNERITTANVVPVIGGTSSGAVGSYAFAFLSGTSGVTQFGATVAGSQLTPSRASGGSQFGTAALTGTWRLMGQSVSSSNDATTTTLFLRIS